MKGELNIKQKVNSLSSDYKECTIEFVLKDSAINIMGLNFVLIEEQQDIDIQAIEEYEIPTMTSISELNIWKDRKKINELIQAVKQLDRNIREEKNDR